MVCLVHTNSLDLSMQEATKDDLLVLHSLDIELGMNPHKEKELETAFQKGHLYICHKNNKTIGYAVFDYQFNGFGYVRYIFVGSLYRGKGYGLKMLKYFESICKTATIYVSAKPSSRDFQNLLFLEDYVKVGVIFNCEEIEPSHLYCKNVTSSKVKN